jgi:collagen triple helix repeat protein
MCSRCGDGARCEGDDTSHGIKYLHALLIIKSPAKAANREGVKMKRTVLLAAGVGSALVVATAGTAAVQALITGAQIQDGTIASRDIKNGTITRTDIGAATLSSLRGQRGAQGARGAVGAQGPAGPVGAAGPQGPTGGTGSTGATGAQGPQGVKGDPGAGVHVTGSVATAGDLPGGAAEGDAYIVTATSHLHVWDGAAWIDTGLVRGPDGPQGATGPTGPQGPAGPTGPTGPAGADGADGALAGYEIVQGAPVPVPASAVNVVVTANCPAGKVAVGGGVSFADPGTGVSVAETRPTAAGAGWTVTILNFFEVSNTATPYAVCAST